MREFDWAIQKSASRYTVLVICQNTAKLEYDEKKKKTLLESMYFLLKQKSNK